MEQVVYHIISTSTGMHIHTSKKVDTIRINRIHLFAFHLIWYNDYCSNVIFSYLLLKANEINNWWAQMTLIVLPLFKVPDLPNFLKIAFLGFISCNISGMHWSVFCKWADAYGRSCQWHCLSVYQVRQNKVAP